MDKYYFDDQVEINELDQKINELEKNKKKEKFFTKPLQQQLHLCYLRQL